MIFRLRSKSETLKKIDELVRAYPVKATGYYSSIVQKLQLSDFKGFDGIKCIETPKKCESGSNGTYMACERVEITEVRDIYYFPIKNYLKNVRKISLEVASKYQKEIYFIMNGKRYFGLCHQNRTGGYEVRGCGEKPFKTVIGSKDISFFKGNNTESKTILIFEGMFDFESYLEYEKITESKDDTIILNSLSLQKRTVELIQQSEKYKEVHLYLDNDEEGRKSTQRFQIELNKFIESKKSTQNKSEMKSIGDIIGKVYRVVDMSLLYKDYKDLNDWWVLNEG